MGGSHVKPGCMDSGFTSSVRSEGCGLFQSNSSERVFVTGRLVDDFSVELFVDCFLDNLHVGFRMVYIVPNAGFGLECDFCETLILGRRCCGDCRDSLGGCVRVL